MTARESNTRLGVRDAWDFYLGQHPYSIPEVIEQAAKAAVADWLERNTELVAAALSQAVTATRSCSEQLPPVTE